MALNLSGGCACGAVRYQSDAEPLAMLNCHCRDCQRAGGGAYAPVVVLPQSGVRLAGELRYHRIVGAAGKAVERGFCPRCGSQVAVKLERMPDAIGLQAASLDDPSLYRPAMDIFTESAQHWDKMDPALQKHARAPW
jgi:hypothetical protein